MIRTLLGLLSPPGPSARLSILIFHRVLAAPDPLLPDEPYAESFDRICGWLRRWFNVLPLDEAAGRLRAGRLPARAMAITFDDGYADNHDVAMPILRSHGLVATFFVATGFLDGGRMWNDTLIESVRHCRLPRLDVGAAGLPDLPQLPLGTFAERLAAIDVLIRACRYLDPARREEVVHQVARAAAVSPPDNLMMTSGQVQAMHRAGMGIGGHTVSHPILAGLSQQDALREIRSGKLRLEDLIQAPVELFAYPNGRPGSDYTADHAELARDVGFKAAVSTAWGAATASSHPYQLPRFTPWDRSRVAFGLRLLHNTMRHGATA